MTRRRLTIDRYRAKHGATSGHLEDMTRIRVDDRVREPVRAQSDAHAVACSLADPAQFAPVFDRHFAAVHRYLHRRAGRDIADELAGETFRVAFETRERWSR